MADVTETTTTDFKLPNNGIVSTIGGSLGFLYGLYYAFKGKKSFWPYVGYSFLFGIGGSVAGSLVDFTIDKVKK